MPPSIRISVEGISKCSNILDYQQGVDLEAMAHMTTNMLIVMYGII